MKASKLNEHTSIKLDDDRWFREVYQGDHVPQLTVRAVAMGAIIGMFMSISNLYTTVKLGWSFGVAITSCVISFVSWSALRALSRGRLSRMSVLENNCMQSTASAAGYSTGGTLGTACGALLLITGDHISPMALFPFVLLTAALGVFVAIPMKRQMINIDQLPFPSGIAAAYTIKSLYSRGSRAMKKAYSLIIALSFGSLVGILRTQEGMIGFLDRLHKMTGQWLRIPEVIAFPASWAFIERGRMIGFGFEPSVLLIGAGLIVGLRVALSMFLGSVILHFFIAPLLVRYDLSMQSIKDHVPSFAYNFDGSFLPTSWALWPGASIIVFASLTTVALGLRSIVYTFNSLKKNQTRHRHPSVEVPFSWFVVGILPISVGLCFINWWAFHMHVMLSIFAIMLSFLLALVTCRATGETDTAPVGAMGKVTQLIYALIAQGNVTINLMSAGTTASAAGSAADLLTDLKSGYLLGANPRKQFLAQFCGVFFGTIAVVPAWYLMFPDSASLEKFHPPATNMWKAVAIALTEGLHTVPITAQWAIIIGALIGVLLPLLNLSKRMAPYLPSAMGLGLSFIMPFHNCLSFAIGAVIAWAWLKIARKNALDFSIPVASGLIAGESLMAALIAMGVAIPSAINKIFP